MGWLFKFSLVNRKGVVDRVYDMIDIIIEMYKKGFSIEKICKKVKLGRSYVELVIDNI